MDNKSVVEPSVIKIKTEILQDESVSPDCTTSDELVKYIKLEEGCPSDTNETNCQDFDHTTLKRKYDDEENSEHEPDKGSQKSGDCIPHKSLRTYLEHNKESDTNRVKNYYQCPECPYNSKQKTDFTKHFEAHLTKIGEKCAHCNFRTSKCGLKKHEILHVKKKPVLKCRLCPFVITSGRKNLERHLLLDHNVSAGTSQVNTVEPIISKNADNSHQCEVKREVTSPMPENIEMTTNTEDYFVRSGDESQSRLSHPQLTVQSELNRRSDQNFASNADETVELPYIKTELYSLDESATDDSSNPYIFFGPDGTQWFKCKSVGCPYKTNKYFSLKRHRLSHIRKGPLRCQYCSFCCKGHGKFALHLLQHVEEQNDVVTPDIRDTNRMKWFVCSNGDCPYKTEDLNYLKKHRVYHERKSRFSCQYCSYSCNGRGILKLHLRQHNEDGDYFDKDSACASKRKEQKTDGIKSVDAGSKHKNPKKIKSRLTQKFIKSLVKFDKKSRKYYYQCPECPFKNIKKTKFVIHFDKHSATIGEKCPYCTFRGTELGVRRHKLIHTKRKSFWQCPLGSAQMTKMSVFGQHRRYKHDKSSKLQLSRSNSNRENKVASEQKRSKSLAQIVDLPSNNLINTDRSLRTDFTNSLNGLDTAEHTGTQGDIMAVILKEASVGNCDDASVETGSAVNILRRPSTTQSAQIDSESHSTHANYGNAVTIKEVILKQGCCDVNSSNKENAVCNEEKQLFDKSEDKKQQNDISAIENRTITITITTVNNCNDTALIKTALVSEILKSFDVSNVQEESHGQINDCNGEKENLIYSDNLKPQKTAAVDVLNSFNTPNVEVESNNSEVYIQKPPDSCDDNISRKTPVITDVLRLLNFFSEEDESDHLNFDNSKNNENTQDIQKHSDNRLIKSTASTDALKISNFSDKQDHCCLNDHSEKNKDSNTLGIHTSSENGNDDTSSKPASDSNLLKSFNFFNEEEIFCDFNDDNSEFKKPYENSKVAPESNCTDSRFKSPNVSNVESYGPSSNKKRHANLNKAGIQNSKNCNVERSVKQILKSFDFFNEQEVFGSNKICEDNNVESQSSCDNSDLMKSTVSINLLKLSDICNEEEESCGTSGNNEKNKHLDEVESENFNNNTSPFNISNKQDISLKENDPIENFENSSLNCIDDETTVTVVLHSPGFCSTEKNLGVLVDDKEINKELRRDDNKNGNFNIDDLNDSEINGHLNISYTEKSVKNCIDDGFKTQVAECASELASRNPRNTHQLFCCTVNGCPYKTYDKRCLKKHQGNHEHKAPNKCSYCSFSCNSLDKLDLHLRHHSKQNSKGQSTVSDTHLPTVTSNIQTDAPPKRDLCEQSDNLDAIRRHISEQKDTKQITWYRCSFCPQKYLNHQSLMFHQRRHPECDEVIDGMECPFCSFTTVSGGQSLILHLEIHVRKEHDKFRCPFCNMTIAKKELVLCHIRLIHHKDIARMKKHRSKSIQADKQCSSNAHTDGNLNCVALGSACSGIKINESKDESIRKDAKYTAVQVDWLEDKETVTALPSTTEQPESNEKMCQLTAGRKNNGVEHQSHNKIIVFQCTHCPTKCLDEKLLKLHVKRHSSPIGVQCPVCTYRNDKTNLLKHLSCHSSSSAGVFRCPLCSAEKRSQENMSDHLKVEHSRALFQSHEDRCTKLNCNGFCKLGL